MSRYLAILSASLCVAACHSDRAYVGVGDVAAVDGGGQVTICHDEIGGLMAAGTTRFDVAEEARALLTPGVRVRFELRRAGDQLVIARANVLTAGNPGIHDHTPHHGGVVAMVGMIHLEAKASPEGRVQLYLTDVWRRPLPTAMVQGTVTLDVPDGKRTLPLVAVADSLEARGPALTQRTVNAAFALKQAGQPVELNFVLPIGTSDTGAAGIPAEGCMEPTAEGAAGQLPRCVLRFAKPIAALAAKPDGAMLLVGVLDLGVSAWRLPAGQFAVGFAPPPTVVGVAELPHPEVPTALAVRPDGREVMIAMEDQLLFYAMDTGRVVRTLNSPGGNVRAAAWSSDGRTLLVAASFNSTVSLLDPADGRVRKRFPLRDPVGAAVAFAPDGRSVAVGSDAGAVWIFDVETASPTRVLRGTRTPVRDLAFVGERLLALTDEGVLAWKISPDAWHLERKFGPAARVMAANADRGVVASAGTEARIELIRLSDGAHVDTLAWHAAPVSSLVWAGQTLISGDSSGRVALWNVVDAPRTGSPAPRVAPTATQKPVKDIDLTKSGSSEESGG